MIIKKKKTMSNNELRELRRVAGLSQAKLASLLGTSQPYVSSLELEYTNPRRREITSDIERQIRSAITRFLDSKKNTVKRKEKIEEEKKSPLYGFRPFTEKRKTEKTIRISKNFELHIATSIDKECSLGEYKYVIFLTDGSSDTFALRFYKEAKFDHSYKLQRRDNTGTIRVNCRKFLNTYGFKASTAKNYKWFDHESTLIIYFGEQNDD